MRSALSGKEKKRAAWIVGGGGRTRSTYIRSLLYEQRRERERQHAEKRKTVFSEKGSISRGARGRIPVSAPKKGGGNFTAGFREGDSELTEEEESRDKCISPEKGEKKRTEATGHQLL